ncbi:uncharacterized protein N7483_001546 [Penicillium malachiteum]|uniref:uncharacterized protein n=1 Tax=Penicillium malachiteum TaxID=1324776 RepID=UPI00254992A9|nr:uncharacterized protein N7483_001546 [Penicillium malachiteum]KAJ5736421.1 hypothetical protein N7483_001546 [Penicillium malachiteum]
MSESWSHLTQNPLSTTPGFLGEIYTGEMYQIKSESAVSASTNIEAQSDEKNSKEYLPGESWWAHCLRTTSRCTIYVTIGLFLLCIAIATVLILMATNVIYVPPRNHTGNRYAPSGVIDDPTKPIRPLMYGALMNRSQISTGVEILPIDTTVSLPTVTDPTGPTVSIYPITDDTVTIKKDGFVTQVRPSPTQH